MQPVHKTSITSLTEFKGIISVNKCSSVLAWMQSWSKRSSERGFAPPLLPFLVNFSLNIYVMLTGLFPYFSPNHTHFYNSMERTSIILLISLIMSYHLSYNDRKHLPKIQRARTISSVNHILSIKFIAWNCSTVIDHSVLKNRFHNASSLLLLPIL